MAYGGQVPLAGCGPVCVDGWTAPHAAPPPGKKRDKIVGFHDARYTTRDATQFRDALSI
jgi:hypothetical protein